MPRRRSSLTRRRRISSTSFLRKREQRKKKWAGDTFRAISFPSRFDDSKDVQHYVERLKLMKKTVEGIIGAGQVLKEAKAKLGYGHYGAMLRRLGLYERIAQMLMVIADNAVISNPKNFSVLPSRYTSLHRLCLIPDDKLQELIDDRDIWRSMKGDEVKALAFKTLDGVPSAFKAVVTVMDKHREDDDVVRLVAALRGVTSSKRSPSNRASVRTRCRHG